MSAPAVERPESPVAPPVLPWPLRVVAAIGRVLLSVRRGLRRAIRTIGRGLEWLGRSPVVAGPIAALSVALAGLIVFGLVVAGAWWGGVETPGPWDRALSITGSVWVMAHGVPLRFMGVDYSLIPWGLVIVPGWLAHQAGRHLGAVVRPNRWPTLALTWAVPVLVGAAFVAGVSVVADIPDVQTSARRAVVMALLVGIVGIGSGLWRASALLREEIARIPAVFRVMVRSSFVGFTALVGFSALVLAIAAGNSFGEISAVVTALEPTAFDTVVLLVLSLGYLPTLIGWSMGYLVGAGVSLGPDVLVSPFVPAIPPTPLPAFPPLAALPEASGPASWALPALVVLAGALIGLSISRLAFREGPLIRIALALISSTMGACWIFVLLWISSGSLGDGRLAEIGPDAGLGALLAGAGFVIGALPTSVLRAQRSQRERSRRLRSVPSGDDDVGNDSTTDSVVTPA